MNKSKTPEFDLKKSANLQSVDVIVKNQNLPSFVSPEFTVLDASLIVEEVRFLLRSSFRPFIIVHRVEADLHYYYYYATNYIEEILSQFDAMASLAQVLNLHEYTANPTINLSSMNGITVKPELPNYGIVIDGIEPVGIVPKIYMADIPKVDDYGAGIAAPAPPMQPIKRAILDECEEEAKAVVEDVSPAEGGEPSKDVVLLGTGDKKISYDFHAEMPPQVKVNVKETLFVEISQKKIRAAAHEASSTESIDVSSQDNLTVRVIPKRNLEIVGKSVKPGLVPDPQKPINLMFDVKGTDIGAGEIWVSCCRGSLCLALLKLKPVVVAASDHLTLTAISADGKVADNASPGYQGNQIDIYTVINGSCKRYKYVVHLSDIDDEFLSDEFKSDILAVLEPIVTRLDKAVAGTPAEFELLMQDLRTYGSQLYKELFPEKLQRTLWERREKIDHIKLYCEEPFVPWELLYITEPGGVIVQDSRFLGELGLVRWEHGYIAPAKIRIRKGRAKFIAPVYQSKNLKNVQDECDLLKTLFQAEPVTPATRTEVTQILRGPGAFDLFHFAGHGKGSNSDVSQCAIELELPAGVNSSYQNLTPGMVSSYSQLKDDQGNRPMVVLNACRSDKSAYFLTSAAGFAQAFLEREAGVFIGTLWSVEDAAASKFMKVLYTELSAKKTMSQATKSARTEIMKMKDATFLAYAVYAHPFACLETDIP
jgi:hypothetical protein